MADDFSGAVTDQATLRLWWPHQRAVLARTPPEAKAPRHSQEAEVLVHHQEEAITVRRVLVLLVLVAAVPCLAQQGGGNDCTLAGTWYGGSVVAYQLTIVQSVPAGHYTIFAQGVYKAAAITATVTGEVVKKGKAYEGSMLSLTGDDSFVNLPPGASGKMPDLEVGWQSIEMLDCNTIKNTIPFFGTYFGPP